MLSAFHRTGPGDFVGYAYDPSDPARRFLVEVLVDGAFHCALRADGPGLDDVPSDTPCGFVLRLPDELASGAEMIEARIANTALPVGTPIRLDQTVFRTLARAPGEVRWTGDLSIDGWSAEEDPLLVLVDGVAVDEVRPTVWRHVSLRSGHAVARRGFTTHLPDRFADGAVHECAVVTRQGESLAGCPFAFLAWPDRLADLAATRNAGPRDQSRARLFDTLVPASVPFTAYQVWGPRHPHEAAAKSDQPRCGLILVGPGDADTSVASLKAQPYAAWVAAALPSHGTAGFSADDLKAVLRADLADASFLVFALAGTVFHDAALTRFSTAFSGETAAEIIYGDVDLRSADGSLWPLAFPAFDRERLLEQGYFAHLFALRLETAIRALETGVDSLYALLMAAVFDETGAARAILHLPGAVGILPSFDRQEAGMALAAGSLAYLHRFKLAGTVSAGQPGVLPGVRLNRLPLPVKTTIMIPTRNRRDLLESCIQSIQPALRRHACEILILDNETSDPDTVSFLEELERAGIRRIDVPGPFNFARMNNIGATAASGALLCLMNNDVQAQDPNWLDMLLGTMAEPDVGAVAPMLLWPSRVIQHGGLVLGPGFEVAHAFGDRIEGDPGYTDLLRVTHECSAVSAACMLTRRRDYLAVGGMDERRFPINFNDVDYCLKLRAAGRRVVLNPHARLIHAESASRGKVWPEDRRRLFQQERRALQLKWGAVLADDPLYSPVLALTPEPYSALSRHDRAMPPRFNTPPVARELPDGF